MLQSSCSRGDSGCSLCHNVQAPASWGWGVWGREAGAAVAVASSDLVAVAVVGLGVVSDSSLVRLWPWQQLLLVSSAAFWGPTHANFVSA